MTNDDNQEKKNRIILKPMNPLTVGRIALYGVLLIIGGYIGQILMSSTIAYNLGNQDSGFSFNPADAIGSAISNTGAYFDNMTIFMLLIMLLASYAIFFLGIFTLIAVLLSYTGNFNLLETLNWYTKVYRIDSNQITVLSYFSKSKKKSYKWSTFTNFSYAYEAQNNLSLMFSQGEKGFGINLFQYVERKNLSALLYKLSEYIPEKLKFPDYPQTIMKEGNKTT